MTRAGLNDRLLLGLKGSMAEFELGLLRQRAREAFEQKIQRGHALWELPVGFVRTEEDLVEKIADRQVQEAIASVFRKFREFGSARQTMLWYHDQHIPLPTVLPGTGSTDIIWQLPTGNRLYQIVKNPIYAGALAYGKTAAKTVVEDQRARTASTRRRKPPEEWTILLRDNHAGYISWDEYLANQRILEANVARRGGTTPGAAKRGPALLAGLLRCGRCGRKLFVAYSGRGGRVPRYACAGSRTGQGPTTCLSLGGVTIEQAVTDQVLEAVQPVGIEAALAALDQLDHTHTEQRRALELAVEKARYQAQRAERQYHTVDPDNRLVAGELEVRWNDALARVGQLGSGPRRTRRHADGLDLRATAARPTARQRPPGGVAPSSRFARPEETDPAHGASRDRHRYRRGPPRTRPPSALARRRAYAAARAV